MRVVNYLFGLLFLLVPSVAAAAYDANGVALGASTDRAGESGL